MKNAFFLIYLILFCTCCSKEQEIPDQKDPNQESDLPVRIIGKYTHFVFGKGETFAEPKATLLFPCDTFRFLIWYRSNCWYKPTGDTVWNRVGTWSTDRNFRSLGESVSFTFKCISDSLIAFGWGHNGTNSGILCNTKINGYYDVEIISGVNVEINVYDALTRSKESLPSEVIRLGHVLTGFSIKPKFWHTPEFLDAGPAPQLMEFSVEYGQYWEDE